jgi:hypothetical protein
LVLSKTTVFALSPIKFPNVSTGPMSAKNLEET